MSERLLSFVVIVLCGVVLCQTMNPSEVHQQYARVQLDSTVLPAPQASLKYYALRREENAAVPPRTPRKVSLAANNLAQTQNEPRNRSTASENAPTMASNSTDSGVHAPSALDCSMDYLSDLLKEKKQLSMFPQVFEQAERLIDEEINRVRMSLFQWDFVPDGLILPEPEGRVVVSKDRVFVPVDQYPDYNFVGRILGPRGMTAKQLEQETGCRIMVRGRGSMRDKQANRGKPNWEHLDDPLHVLIQCEDTPNRCSVKMKAAIQQINKLLIPAPEGADELKRKQLMELAIINGTYRPLHHNQKHEKRLQTHRVVSLVSPVRAAPLYVTPTSSPVPGHHMGSLHNGMPMTPFKNNSFSVGFAFNPGKCVQLSPPNSAALDYAATLMNQLHLDANTAWQLSSDPRRLSPLAFRTENSLINAFTPAMFTERVSSSTQ